jgi:hypothetical protein
VFDNWVTEPELLDDAKKHNIKLTARTLRKWRARRLLPYSKLGRQTIYPRNWSDELKIIKSRNA